MSHDEKQVIKQTLKGLQQTLNRDWEFQEAELINGELLLRNYKGLKFKIKMEYVGYEKNED